MSISVPLGLAAPWISSDRGAFLPTMVGASGKPAKWRWFKHLQTVDRLHCIPVNIQKPPNLNHLHLQSFTPTLIDMQLAEGIRQHPPKLAKLPWCQVLKKLGHSR